LRAPPRSGGAVWRALCAPPRAAGGRFGGRLRPPPGGRFGGRFAPPARAAGGGALSGGERAEISVQRVGDRGWQAHSSFIIIHVQFVPHT
jgi:hypothetical protein